jgi:DNA-binding FrmR family transcriptional regulator
MVSRTASTNDADLAATVLPPEVLDDLRKRLARVEGQVRGVQRLLDEGAGCKDVIHQVAAVSAAIDRIGYRLIAAGMQHCATHPDAPIDTDDLEQLFLKLS